jgi:mRNA interferase RelE/StbE
MHKLIILPHAGKFLKKIKDKSLKSAFQKIIDTIIRNPFIGDPKTGDLSGVYCCDFFYNQTNYEIAYTIIEGNGKTVVVIILAGTRENFYTELKKYMKDISL